MLMVSPGKRGMVPYRPFAWLKSGGSNLRIFRRIFIAKPELIV